jgi:putative transposase
VELIVVRSAATPARPFSKTTWRQEVRSGAITSWPIQSPQSPLAARQANQVGASNGSSSRKVFVSPATDHPNAEWVVAQAESFCQHVEAAGVEADLVFHDSDTKLCQAFDGVLKAKGLRARRLQPLSPNLNLFVERWIQSIQHECLNHFIVLGERHLNHLISQYVEHYLTERPHQGLDIGNELLVSRKSPDETVPSMDQLDCRERLGGLLKSFSRSAA